MWRCTSRRGEQVKRKAKLKFFPVLSEIFLMMMRVELLLLRLGKHAPSPW
jgi:hypothetical protein